MEEREKKTKKQKNVLYMSRIHENKQDAIRHIRSQRIFFASIFLFALYALNIYAFSFWFLCENSELVNQGTNDRHETFVCFGEFVPKHFMISQFGHAFLLVLCVLIFDISLGNCKTRIRSKHQVL